MKFDELSEEDFAVLRQRLSSGRQSPEGLGFIFPFGALFQVLMLFIIYYPAGYDSYFPLKSLIFTLFLVYTCIFTLVSIPYTFKVIWQKRENIQYFLSIMVAQNIGGISMYLIALFLTGHSSSATTLSLVLFTLATLLIGFLILYFTYKRFLRSLTNGEYRRGSKKGKLRAGVEKGVAKNKSPIIMLSVAIVFIIQFLIRNIGLSNFEDVLLITLGLGLFYTMLFILPEQLVIFYCKKRFASFRFNDSGEINPLVSTNPRKHEASIKKRKKRKKK